jgi:hypothetical protein
MTPNTLPLWALLIVKKALSVVERDFNVQSIDKNNNASSSANYHSCVRELTQHLGHLVITAEFNIWKGRARRVKHSV